MGWWHAEVPGVRVPGTTVLVGRGGWVLPPPVPPTRGEATGDCIRLRCCVGQALLLRGGFGAMPRPVEPF